MTEQKKWGFLDSAALVFAAGSIGFLVKANLVVLQVPETLALVLGLVATTLVVCLSDRRHPSR